MKKIIYFLIFIIIIQPSIAETIKPPFNADFGFASVGSQIALGFSNGKQNYFFPNELESFNLMDPQEGQPVLEYKAKKWKFGAGPRIVWPVKIGLLFYKGAIQASVRKKFSVEADGPTKIPMALDELEQWEVGDSSEHQTYGGISVQASIPLGEVISISGTVDIFSKFSVGFKKMDDSKILLSVVEEFGRDRILKLGASALNGSVNFFKAKLFYSVFELDLKNHEHHELFKMALQGRIDELQSNLPHHSQTVSWHGRAKRLKIGLNPIAVRSVEWIERQNENGAGEFIKEKLSKGKLLKFWRLTDRVYYDDNGVEITWSSAFHKAKLKKLKQFIRLGRILGLKGFDQNWNYSRSIGSIITTMDLSIPRSFFETVRDNDLSEADKILESLCEREALICQRQVYRKNLWHTLTTYVSGPWKSNKRRMGHFLQSHPEIIFSLVVGLKLDQEIYVKFLSTRFQSLEGKLLMGRFIHPSI